MAKKTRAGSQAGPGTPATVALTAAGIPYTAHSYAHDPSTANYGLEAAAALGVDPDRVFKTLLAVADGRLVVGIVPVSRMLHLGSLAAAAGAKRALMAEPALAERKTGYVVGGISPLGQRTASPTFLDESATGWPTVFVSGGRRGVDLELAPDDLLRLTGGRLAPLAR
ncbi:MULTISPECIES: Cys-tRNA(Pro) deacylase [Microcella]|uniref:Cys-tRNA(Pro) deacylase n=1 Tax=Microcella TaxID=337004 RepID=UPI0015CF2414|nr:MULTISPECIES: Cys-tRNA(Pro) deacylase [Microcella]QOD93094.1 Cys-tRNA(Pro) deacylase [Chryseoglobus sp. 28M-23]